MATLDINIPKPPIPTGKTLWVDAENGNDATALVDRQDRPFLTLTAARDAASSGDTVWVRPGSYTTSTPLVKNGVNWHGDVGATITGTSSGGANGIFNCLEAAVSFVVSGDFNIVQVVSGSATEVHAAVMVNNDAANVQVSCRSISLVAETDTMDGAYTVAGFKGTLVVHAYNQISLTGLLGVAAVYWEQGPMYVHCPHIYSEFQCVTSYAGSGNTEFFVDADLIESTVGNAINMNMGDPALRTWIRAKNVISRGDNVAVTIGSSGKFYLHCDKIAGGGEATILMTVGVPNNAEAWITTQKLSASNKFIQAGAGKAWIEVQQYEDTGGLTAGIQVQDDTLGVAPPTVYILGGFMQNTTGDGINISGGTLNVTDLTIDTSADNTASPVVVSGGALLLKNCNLKAEATQDSISAATPRTVTVLSSYASTEIGTNVSVVGSLQVAGGAATAGQVPVANADGTWDWSPLVVDTVNIADNAVTFAKLQDMPANHLIGRHTAGSGDPQEINIDGGLELNGANLRRSALTGDVTASAGSNSTTIANDAVTNAKLANMAEATIKGRQAGSGTGDPEDLTATQAQTALGLGTAALVNTGTGSGDVPTTSQADGRYLTPFAYSLLPAWTVGTQATTSVTLADVTNTELTVPGAGMYEFEYRITYNANATTTGAGFAARNTVGGTVDYASIEVGLDTLSGDRSTFRGGFVADLFAASSRATTGNAAIVRGRVVFNAASAVRLQFRTEIATTTTITVTDVIGFIRRVA